MARRSGWALMLPLALLWAAPLPALAQDAPADQVSGVIRTINGGTLLLATRSGALVQVDASAALLAHQTSLLAVGGAVTALGDRDAQGVLHASAVGRAKASPLAWPADH